MKVALNTAGSPGGIWVFLEQDGGELQNVSLEILGKARELSSQSGESVTGVLLGYQVRRLGERALRHGADQVLLAEDPLLEFYLSDRYTAVFSAVVAEQKPNIVLIGATHNGRDLAGRTAVRIKTGLTADVVRLEIDPESGTLVGAVPGFGGGILALVECPRHRPQMATVRPGVFQAVEREGQGGIDEIAVPPFPIEKLPAEILERETAQGVDITQAKVIVAGGAGLDGDFRMVQELAGLLGGLVGASRVAADNGWISHEHQIGQTGYTVRPKVCICAGISGAAQFTCGIDDSEVVMAINVDPEALIFEHADYVVVGDLNRVLPALVGKVRKEGVGV